MAVAAIAIVGVILRIVLSIAEGNPSMEAGAGTPLLDLFRKGGVDRDIRLMAAQGDSGPATFRADRGVRAARQRS